MSRVVLGLQSKSTSPVRLGRLWLPAGCLTDRMLFDLMTRFSTKESAEKLLGDNRALRGLPLEQDIATKEVSDFLATLPVEFPDLVEAYNFAVIEQGSDGLYVFIENEWSKIDADDFGVAPTPIRDLEYLSVRFPQHFNETGGEVSPRSG